MRRCVRFLLLVVCGFLGVASPAAESGWFDAAGARTSVAALEYSPAAHRWWRIRELSGKAYWETSSDGSSWSSQGSVPLSALFPLHDLNVVLSAASWDGGSPDPGQARYANLNVLR